MKRTTFAILAALLFNAGCATSTPQAGPRPVAVQASARQEHKIVLPENTPISTIADCMNSFAD